MLGLQQWLIFRVEGRATGKNWQILLPLVDVGFNLLFNNLFLGVLVWFCIGFLYIIVVWSMLLRWRYHLYTIVGLARFFNQKRQKSCQRSVDTQDGSNQNKVELWSEDVIIALAIPVGTINRELRTVALVGIVSS
jgi:hypothetical protein